MLAAAVCPGPPLLVPELSGTDATAAELRAACLEAARTLLAARPDVVAVVGPAERTARWPATARADLTVYGGVGTAPTEPAPLSVGLGALLLDWAGCDTDRLMWSVAPTESVQRCSEIANLVVRSGNRVGLLAVADGSARRTVKAPGYLDDRAADYDAEVLRAVSTGDLATLRALDRAVAAELLASGWPALQVLAAAFADNRPHATVHYADAPFGVGYLVASLLP
jgi:hypothetical protein